MKFQKSDQIGEVFYNEKHLEWIRKMPCHICGRAPDFSKIDPHHVQVNSRQRKRQDDRNVVPLCRPCHSQLHASPLKWDFRKAVKLYWGISPENPEGIK